MNTCLNSIGNFDKNLDGVITISDLSSSIKAVINLPLEIVFDLMETTEAYKFFEINHQSCTSNTTLVMSCILWVSAMTWLISRVEYTDEQARIDYEQKKKDIGY